MQLENPDHEKTLPADALKAFSKWVIQDTAEATDNLVKNKITDKSTRVPKTWPQNNLETNEEILRSKYISPKLRQKMIDNLRLKED